MNHRMNYRTLSLPLVHRLLVCAILIGALLPFTLAAAQSSTNYRSDVLGLSFDYPAEWIIREQLNTQTVIAAAESDLTALADGNKPQDLLFSVTISTLRQIGARNPDDFPAVLARVAGEQGIAQPVRMGGANGLSITKTDIANDLATSTALLSVGQRRVAIVRGVSTLAVWMAGGERRFAELIAALSFFPPPNGINFDAVGVTLWQLPAASMPDLVDISVSANGATIWVTERNKGIWQVNANGVGGEVIRPAEVGVFGGIATLRDGTQYISDPATHALWLRQPGESTVRRVLGGQVGTGRGAFGPTSPRDFAFGNRVIYVLDVNEGGTRIQVFQLGGSPITFWAVTLPEGAENPMMATDSEGSAYILAKGMAGILKMNAAGQVARREIGADALANTVPTAFEIDRFDNFYVATADQGILHLDNDGQLMGVIGEPYDESAPPKPGQLGRPVALVLDPTGGPMYVVDVGKYPQIVAFALDGNTAVSLEAGTVATGELTYGQTVEGTITEASFFHEYTFMGKAGDTVTITVSSGAFDTYVDLRRPDDKTIAANDDAGVPGLAATDAQIKDLKLPTNGEYTIRVTRFGREAAKGGGAYTLKLEGKAKE